MKRIAIDWGIKTHFKLDQHSTVYSVQCTVYIVHCKVSNIQWEECSMHCLLLSRTGLQFMANKQFRIEKNPAYGRHQLSRPMQIVGPIQFWRGCVIYQSAPKSGLDPRKNVDSVHAKVGTRENADSIHPGTHPRF